MTDRPIIFSAPMVRALLDGRKTMTRRLAWKPLVIAIQTEGRPTEEVRDASPWQRVQPGDRLWVRESVCADEHQFGLSVRYIADDGTVHLADTEEDRERHFLLRAYRTADPDLQGPFTVPSIHMPRWASRLTLTVTAVRVERLQEISEEDVLTEGARCEADRWTHDADAFWFDDARTSFRHLWDEIHDKGAWDANPEVVVLTFIVERRNIDDR